MEEGNGDWIRDRGDSVFTRIQGYYSVQVRKNSWGDNEGEDTGFWERLHNSGGSLVVRHVERPSRAAGGPTVMFIKNFVE